jgi:translation initiation factor IF-1
VSGSSPRAASSDAERAAWSRPAACRLYRGCGTTAPAPSIDARSVTTVRPENRPCDARARDVTAPEEEAISTKEETIEFEGEVTEALRNGMFRIALDNGHETIGYAAGRMRRYRIRIMLGDRVKVQLSAYDLNRGRIVYRYK